MNDKKNAMGGRYLKWTAVAFVCAAVWGCASVQPVALSQQEVDAQVKSDGQAMRKEVEPITAPLTLDEAMARALKYNLDRRVRMMEEALALGQLDASKFDMLPKIMAQAGYTDRDKTRFTWSSRYPNGFPSSTNPADSSTTSERIRSTADLGFTWSLLDVGLGYYGARQQADRFLIAGEKRRKAMHLLMQDVRTAYWRTASAQLLKADVSKTIALAEEALADSRKSGVEKLKNPLEPLRYQRQLLENLRLLENINQELSSAQIDLSTLINAPLGQKIEIASTAVKNIEDELSKVPVEKLEEVALRFNPDLREQSYNARIAREETRRTLVRLFPNINFNYGTKFDSDRYLLDNQWNEAGLQLSFNLMNVFSADTLIKQAEAGVALADQRRVAAHAAVLAQVHLSRLQVLNARSQFERADAIFETDHHIAKVTRARQMAAAQSKLDVVSTETASILSLLRRYQALAQVQVAENRMLATLGLEPQIGSTQELSLKALTDQLGQSKAPWREIMEGTVPVKVSTSEQVKR